VTADLIAEAQAGDERAFGQLIDPYRRELQLHCYRILGSVHDAEDALQETLLAAWQGLSGFEGRASIRTWLYRVAHQPLPARAAIGPQAPADGLAAAWPGAAGAHPAG
jgi:DNA-directed RNA polymerase specialized sigma24 family protein